MNDKGERDNKDRERLQTMMSNTYAGEREKRRTE